MKYKVFLFILFLGLFISFSLPAQTWWNCLISINGGNANSVIQTKFKTIIFARDNNIYRGLPPWNFWIPNSFSGVECLAYDSIANVVYAGKVNGGVLQIFKSLSDGVYFSPCTDIGAARVEDMMVSDSGKLYVATKSDLVNPGGLYCSSDMGNTWTLLTSPAQDIICITKDNYGNIYAGSQDTTPGAEGIILKSADGGVSWTTLGFGELGQGYVNGLSVDEAGYIFAMGNADTLYVSNNGGPFVISKTGMNHIERFPILSTSCKLTLIGDYLSGVYETSDHGVSWLSAPFGMCSNTIRDLKMGSSGNILAASGFGASMSGVSYLVPGIASIGTFTSIPCSGNQKVFKLNNPNVTGAIWSVPVDWTINSAQADAIVVTLGSISGDVCAIPFNECDTGQIGCLNVNVFPLPDTAVISGPDTICFGSSQSYTATSANATSIGWMVPNGWTINSGWGTFNLLVTAGNVSGNITALPQNSNCTGVNGMVFLTSGWIPETAVISGPSSVCQGDLQVFSAASADAVGFSWNVPSGWTITTGQGTDHITAIAGSAGGSVCAMPFNSNCTGATGCMLSSVVLGIQENPAAEDIEFSPNLFYDRFVLVNKGHDVARLTLISVEGKLLLEAGVIPGENSFNVSGISKGIYLVRIQQGNEVILRKVLSE